MRDSIFCDDRRNLILLPGEFASEEYEYVMGNDGVITVKKKGSSSNSGSNGVVTTNSTGVSNTSSVGTRSASSGNTRAGTSHSTRTGTSSSARTGTPSSSTRTGTSSSSARAGGAGSNVRTNGAYGNSTNTRSGNDRYPKKKKSSIWVWVFGILIAIYVLGLIMGSNGTTQPADNYGVQPSAYQVFKGDFTWYEADEYAGNNGARLATINSEEEFTHLCNLAYENGIRVLWVGAVRDSDNWDTSHWNDGQTISYVKWYPGEPSYYEADGTSEEFLMLFYVNGEWYFNDSANDVSKYYAGKIGFITES